MVIAWASFFQRPARSYDSMVIRLNEALGRLVLEGAHGAAAAEALSLASLRAQLEAPRCRAGSADRWASERAACPDPIPC